MRNRRRNFFKFFTALLAGVGLASTAFAVKASKKNRFIHNVYFWLNNPDNAEEAAQLEAGINSLSKIKLVKDYHLGKPAPTDRPVIDNTYSYHLMLVFDNLEDQNAYQVDPTHKKFVENCENLWKKVQVYDSDASLMEV